MGAGGGDDCRKLEAGRMAADSGESRKGLAAGDEASGNGGTGLRLSGTRVGLGAQAPEARGPA